MEILNYLFPPESIAYSIFVIAFTCALGLALGGIKIFKIKLGIAGVLFVGIIFGHLGFYLHPEILHFLREFGLILFVYSIGSQVGPGFFSSFKKEGFKLNALAASIVVLGIIAAVIIKKMFHFDGATAVGMYSGAVTNTPSLGAAQQAMKSLAPDLVNNISVGYALAYPGAILGIIFSMLAIRRIFKKSSEEDILNSAKGRLENLFSSMSIKIENPNLDGIKIEDIPAIDELSIVVSRILRDCDVSVATHDTQIKTGDIILAVGKKENLRKFAMVVGSESDTDIKKRSANIINSRIVITKNEFIGKSIEELKLQEKYNVAVTRAARADIEFIVSEKYVLQFGDNIVVVGSPSAVKKVSAILGNSPKDLNHPNLIPILIGMTLGIVLGSIPFYIPGISVPVKLGLAGGPLIMAIVLSYIQHIGTLSWYIPPSANLMMRELGIVLFLSCVGLKAGHKFFETLLSGSGIYIVLLSFMITVIPILIVGIVAKYKFNVNFLALCGLLSGSMTDPPALAFANSISPAGLSSMSYATVYPLVMILRIISAQIIVFIFMG